MKWNYLNEEICIFEINSTNIRQGELRIKVIEHKFYHIIGNSADGNGGKESNIQFKIMSENLKYTISMKEQLQHGCFFPGPLDFFILIFLSLSEPCLWFDLSAPMNPWTKGSSYAPGTTGNEWCCCWTHKTGQKSSMDTCSAHVLTL